MNHKEDKRNKLITLTPKGNAYAGKIVEALHKNNRSTFLNFTFYLSLQGH